MADFCRQCITYTHYIHMYMAECVNFHCCHSSIVIIVAFKWAISVATSVQYKRYSAMGERGGGLIIESELREMERRLKTRSCAGRKKKNKRTNMEQLNLC